MRSLRQPLNQRIRQRGPLAHGQHNVEIRQQCRGIVFARERLLEEDNIGEPKSADQSALDPRNVLPIIEHCYSGHSGHRILLA